MNPYYTLFDPKFIKYNRDNILELCEYFDRTEQWEDVYPGVPLCNKRGAIEVMVTDARLIIDAFHPDLNITYHDTQLLRIGANQRGLLHKDTDRSCGILFPLTPIGENYSSVVFFDDNREFVSRVNYSTSAIILNVLQYHDVEPSNVDRVNFQINFQIPYEDVCELLETGKLFRTTSQPS